MAQVTHIAGVEGVGEPTTTMTAVLPNPVTTGDIAHCWFGTRNDITATTPTDNGSSGTYTKFADNAADTAASGVFGWSRPLVAGAPTGGDDGATVTNTGGNANGSANGISIFRDCAAPTQVAGFGLALGVETFAGLTVSADSLYVVVIFDRSNDALISNVSGTNCGALTQSFQHQSSGGSDCTLTVWYVDFTGDVGTITFDKSDGASWVFHYELPAAAVGTIVPKVHHMNQMRAA